MKSLRTFLVGMVALTILTSCGPEYVGPAEPPAVRTEVVGTAPGPGYVWINGNWVWRRGWVWMPGRWLLPPYAGALWIPGHWVRGYYGRWRFIPGHWR